MSRVAKFFGRITINLKTMTVRFPIVLLLIAFYTVILSMQIEKDWSDDTEILMRLAYSGLFGAFFGIAIQFACERFERIAGYRKFLTLAPIVMAVLYFFLMTSPEQNEGAVVVRLMVCCFALFSLYIYLPSSKNGADFSSVSLSHFKSAFTALLYGVILFLGLVAIYYAIDLLLVRLDNNLPAHIANIVFCFFTPVYYLSLLPNFNNEDEASKEKQTHAYAYPRFLEILVSYIAIPLITVFSGVLVAYFLKIVFTQVWPVGQIGPMVLGYSAAGLFVYILSGHLPNKFTVLYRKLFPIALIPLVGLQLVSVYIRLNAYGITESRYYVTLFGIYSIVCALYLIISKSKKQGIIVLLAACFAIISIIPPIDAFSVSRVSQTNRIEQILISNGMLVDQKIIPKKNVSDKDKNEITSIINYMTNMGHLTKLQWLPKEYRTDYKIYDGFEKVFGFSQYYMPNYPEETPQYFYAGLDFTSPVDISAYDSMFRIEFFNTDNGLLPEKEFTLNNKNYSINQKIGTKGEILLSVVDSSGAVLITLSTEELIQNIISENIETKMGLPVEKMSTGNENAAASIKLIIENIDINLEDVQKLEDTKKLEFGRINGSGFVLVSIKE